MTKTPKPKTRKPHLPCPFCKTRKHPQLRFSMLFGYVVQCPACWARAAPDFDERKAIKAWNTRR